MIGAEQLAKLNLLQRSFRFKVIASVLVVVSAVVGFSVWWTLLNAPSDDPSTNAPAAQVAPDSRPRDAFPPSTSATDDTQAVVASPQTGTDLQPRLDPNAVLRAIGSRDATLGVAVGFASAAAVSLLIVWLGVGLTYLAILLLTAVVVVPLRLLPATAELGAVLAGVAALAASFTVFIETARVALSGSHPVLAIARTVVAEAVRMKISLVFIIMLIGWLASLPWLLDESQPLRFRVQTFLQNGAAGAFWALALLTLFFTVATITFEQRDKVIWATVVKPVRAWHYVLGKWIGVMAVNVALLAVAASGVFLFTEYLRAQPARGEIAPYVNADGSDRPTTDRLIVEARVLTARDSRLPDLQPVPAEVVRAALDAVVQNELATVEVDTPEIRRAIEAMYLPSTLQRLEASRTAIAPRQYKTYVFRGLSEAKRLGRPVSLRYKVQAGANDPTSLFALMFEFVDDQTNQSIPISIDTPLNIAQSLDLKPSVINERGELFINIYNGDPLRNKANELTLRFPPDGLEVLYVAGGYEANFLRVTAALLIKLGFVAAAGVFASTFLSFPVAALFTFLVLFAAETSGFLKGALEIYTSVDQEGNVDAFRILIRAIAIPISKVFTGYRALDSTDRLVDGRLLSWSEFLGAGLVILALSAVILAAAVLVFKKRELATYSGH